MTDPISDEALAVARSLVDFGHRPHRNVVAGIIARLTAAEAECQHGMALIGELTARAESAEAERDAAHEDAVNDRKWIEKQEIAIGELQRRAVQDHEMHHAARADVEAECDRLRAACETAAKAIGLMERDEELYLKTCGMLIDILEREAPNPSFERLQFIVNVRLALAKSATARAALAGADR